jgi:hypothetical protein
MKRLLLVVVAVLAVAQPMPVQAQTEVYHFRGQGAFVVSSTLAGCVVTDILLGAGRGYNHMPPGPRPVLGSIFLRVFQRDTCTGETLLDAVGDAPIAGNKLTINRHGARLQAVVDVYERVSNAYLDIPIDLRWTAAGDLVRHVTRQHDLANCIATSYVVGTALPAQAAGRMLFRGVNLFPAAPSYALVVTAQQGQVGIYCQTPG